MKKQTWFQKTSGGIPLQLKAHTTWRLEYFFILAKNYTRHKYVKVIDAILGKRPLTYYCSRCSGAAQMANYLAGKLDRKVIAEMSGISAMGGNVIKLAPTAQCGRKIIAIDGCPFDCAKACRETHCLQQKNHPALAGFRLKKEPPENFDMEEANRILKIIKEKRTARHKKVLSVMYSES